MIVNLNREKLAELFEETDDPNLLYEEADNDNDNDAGVDHEHHHNHDHIAPLEP